MYNEAWGYKNGMAYLYYVFTNRRREDSLTWFFHITGAQDDIFA